MSECGEDPGTLDLRFLGDYAPVIQKSDTKEVVRDRQVGSFFSSLFGRR